MANEINAVGRGGHLDQRFGRSVSGGWIAVEVELLDVFAPQVGPVAVVVYLVLCCLAGHEASQGVAKFPVTNSQIARVAGVSRPTVRREINRLISAGMIQQNASTAAGSFYTIESLHELANKTKAVA